MVLKYLNETATVHTTPRWHLWDGGFLLRGRARGVVPHHAVQIGIWCEGPGVVVRQDAAHSFACNGALGALLFVDPESNEGVWLQSLLTADITMVPAARLAAAVQERRTFTDEPEAGAFIRY